MKKKRLLFLDIDGVLNNLAHAVIYKAKSYDAATIDDVALGLLKWTCEVTGAEIVISSTWRTMGVDWLMGVFEGKGWRVPPVISKTPQGNGVPRGDEIKEWLDGRTYHTGNCQYVIIDDDSDMLDEQKEYFVHTDPNLGFTIYDAIRVIDILGCKDEYAKNISDLRKHTDFQLNKRYRESSKFQVDE
jgi:hypothetical protein